MERETQVEKEEYQKYVERVTPRAKVWVQCGRAFLTGGGICCVGQGILNLMMGRFGMGQEEAGSWCALILIAVAALLTGLNWYPSLVKWGGAGALVPITGFANSVAAPAMEYQAEGQVFGVGCKIFTIAGPVLLYGILASFLAGLVQYLFALG